MVQFQSPNESHGFGPYREPDPPPVEKEPFLARAKKVPGVKAFVGTVSLFTVIALLFTLLFVPGVFLIKLLKQSELNNTDMNLAPFVSVIALSFGYIAYRFLRGFFGMTARMGGEIFELIERWKERR